MIYISGERTGHLAGPGLSLSRPLGRSLRVLNEIIHVFYIDNLNLRYR